LTDFEQQALEAREKRLLEFKQAFKDMIASTSEAYEKIDGKTSRKKH
jgi:hypothetical protein